LLAFFYFNIKELSTRRGLKMLQKPVLTPKEAAAALGVSYKTILRLAKTRDFPAVKVGERNIRIPADMLQEWLQRKAAQPLE
jgi:excisionase family DNA binding protein